MFTAVQTYQNRILHHVFTLGDVAHQSAMHGQAVNFTDLAYAFTFDTMGDFAFGKDFGLMSAFCRKLGKREGVIDCSVDNEGLSATTIMQAATETLGPLNPATWIVHFGRMLVPFAKQIRDFNFLLYFCHRQVIERLEV